MAGARSLGVPRFRPANTTTDDTRAQRGRQPQRDSPGRERIDARVGQVLRQSAEQQHQHGRAQALAETREPDQAAARFLAGRVRQHRA